MCAATLQDAGHLPLAAHRRHAGPHCTHCAALAAVGRRRAGMLERALKRLEWERVRDAEVKEAADEAERERLANQVWCGVVWELYKHTCTCTWRL